jgi:nucleotide-binding universal stress UspA family protein
MSWQQRGRSRSTDEIHGTRQEDHAAGFRTIVVAIDFSDTSREARRRATELAREGDGALHLVHVVPMPVYAARSLQAPDVEASGVHAPYVEDARGQLRDLAATLAIEPFRVTCVALPGRPGGEIVRYATNLSAARIWSSAERRDTAWSAAYCPGASRTRSCVTRRAPCWSCRRVRGRTPRPRESRPGCGDPSRHATTRMTMVK